MEDEGDYCKEEKTVTEDWYPDREGVQKDSGSESTAVDLL